jgi:hypothetical protein
MDKTGNAFIENRTLALASVYLTRRDDLELVSFHSGGLDLMVRIISGSPGYEQYFGVILHGTTDPLASNEDADRYLTHRARNRKNRTAVPIVSFPVISIVFSMPNDEGYYGWSAEPIVDEEGGPTLKSNPKPACSRLDRKALDQIVAKVEAWYDRLFATLVHT